MFGNSPGVQWLETLAFHGRGHRFNPWWGTTFPQTLWFGQKKSKNDNNNPKHQRAFCLL